MAAGRGWSGKEFLTLKKSWTGSNFSLLPLLVIEGGNPQEWWQSSGIYGESGGGDEPPPGNGKVCLGSIIESFTYPTLELSSLCKSVL